MPDGGAPATSPVSPPVIFTRGFWLVRLNVSQPAIISSPGLSQQTLGLLPLNKFRAHATEPSILFSDGINL